MNRIITFIKSLIWHISLGMPKSSQQEILDRFAICKECDMYSIRDQQCLVCGCGINKNKSFFNKLAWSDQKCPLNKWNSLK